MDPKPDKESEKHGDIVLLFEIIADSIIWQVVWFWLETPRQVPPFNGQFYAPILQITTL